MNPSGRPAFDPDTARPGAPIIPPAASPLGTLMTAMTVMCYLAVLAIAGALLITRAVEGWTSDIAREVTVQVRPLDGVDTDAEVAKARAILAGTSGIADIKVLAVEDARKLLEPWLGRSSVLDELPVPRLIAVSLDPARPPDLEALAARIAAEVQGASLDSHRRWQGELTRTASTLNWLAVAILLLIALSAVVLVVHGTRSALEANREVLEVLYLAGARDGFIAREVLWRFLLVGLKAGLFGLALGFATLGLLALSGTAVAEAARAFLAAPLRGDFLGYAAVLAVPALATVISLATARLAVMRILRSMF